MVCSFLLLLVTGILKFPGFININNPFLYLVLTDIHDLNGIILSIIVVIHGILHLKWILNTTKSLKIDIHVTARHQVTYDSL